jgi:hypothetical protein
MFVRQRYSPGHPSCRFAVTPLSSQSLSSLSSLSHPRKARANDSQPPEQLVGEGEYVSRELIIHVIWD